MNGGSAPMLRLAALWDTFQPSAGRAGAPYPQQLVFTSDSAKAHCEWAQAW